MRRQDKNKLETAETKDHRNRPIGFQVLQSSDTDHEMLYFINSKMPLVTTDSII